VLLLGVIAAGFLMMKKRSVGAKPNRMGMGMGMGMGMMGGYGGRAQPYQMNNSRMY
jgi:hypothetical protein